MGQSPTVRRRAAAITVVVGVLATFVLGVTSLDPSPTRYSAPQSLTELAEFSGNLQVPGGPFYTAPSPIPVNRTPGSLLKSERINDAPEGITAYRLLYTSQTAAGEPNVVSGFFAVRTGPPPGPNGRPLVAVAHSTTGIAPDCGISQAPFTPGSTGYGTWAPIMSGMIGAGFAVVATDYANLGVANTTPNYLIQKGQAYDVLNSLRAAKQLAVDQIDVSKIAIFGHSQGGHAVMSAAYEAPRYAPELAISGTVALAPAFNPPAPMLNKFLGAAPDEPNPGALADLSNAANSLVANYPGQFELSDVFTEKGIEAAKVGLTKCQYAIREAFSGPKKDYLKANASMNLKLVQENSPIYAQYTIPLLIQQGLLDTAVAPGFVLAAARTFCQQGSDVTLQTFPADGHFTLLYTGAPDAIAWMQDRFEGKPTQSSCGGL